MTIEGSAFFAFQPDQVAGVKLDVEHADARRDSGIRSRQLARTGVGERRGDDLEVDGACRHWSG